MRTPDDAKSDMFQYDSPSVFVNSPSGDVYELDGSKLNAIIRKAWSAYGIGWRYRLGGTVDPSLEAKFIIESDPGSKQTDCSGYAWWSSYRKRLGSMWPSNDFYKEISDFIPGSSIRYEAQPGNKYGHASMVVNVLDGGQLETLEMTSDDGKSGIFYRGPSGKWIDGERVGEKTANSWWIRDRVGGTHSVVSTDAIRSINGVPYSPKKINLLLTGASIPIKNWVAIAIAISAVSYFALRYAGNKGKWNNAIN